MIASVTIASNAESLVLIVVKALPVKSAYLPVTPAAKSIPAVLSVLAAKATAFATVIASEAVMVKVSVDFPLKASACVFDIAAMVPVALPCIAVLSVLNPPFKLSVLIVAKSIVKLSLLEWALTNSSKYVLEAVPSPLPESRGAIVAVTGE